MDFTDILVLTSKRKNNLKSKGLSHLRRFTSGILRKWKTTAYNTPRVICYISPNEWIQCLRANLGALGGCSGTWIKLHQRPIVLEGCFFMAKSPSLWNIMSMIWVKPQLLIWQVPVICTLTRQIAEK